MEKQIVIQNQTIQYTLRKSARARRMRLAVYRDGSVVVTSPIKLQETLAERFITEKAWWVFSKLDFFKQFENIPLVRHTYKDYLAHKQSAYELLSKKVLDYSNLYEFRYNKINIRNQKSRWGSCSKKGNLNFNYKIICLPEHIQNYIVVHELCHLKEFNHSKDFWKLVEQILPNYSSIKLELKRSGLMFH